MFELHIIQDFKSLNKYHYTTRGLDPEQGGTCNKEELFKLYPKLTRDKAVKPDNMLSTRIMFELKKDV
jgi:hypothetical protein